VEKRPLGEILVELGLTSPGSIDDALAHQQTTREKLGVILQRLGLVDERHVGAAIKIQGERRSPLRGRRLGEILIDIGAISAEAIETAIEAQRRSGERLGNAIIRLGLASQAAIKKAVTLQRSQDTTLGRLLVRLDLISEIQLTYALHTMAASGRRLGETLVHLGHLDQASLERTLGLQRLIRQGTSVALITVVTVGAANVAQAATGSQIAAGAAQGQATISVNIPERANLQVAPPATADDGKTTKIAVAGGDIDLQFSGPSYLKGATTYSAVGSGPDGAFELRDAHGDTVRLHLSTAADDSGRHIAPNESLSINDIGKLSVDLASADGESEGAPGAVYSGHLTLLVSPQ